MRYGLSAAGGRRRHGRRTALGLIAAGAALVLLAPEAAAVERAIRSRIGARAALTGRIKLDLPKLAENGNIVPITLEVESPMTPADHVTAVHLFADGNPNPEVASFFFSPHAARARIATRIRLATSQNVIAVAEMSDGRVFRQGVPVEVSLGGCSN